MPARVGDAHNIADGEIRAVDVDGTKVSVAAAGGKLDAFDDTCTTGVTAYLIGMEQRFRKLAAIDIVFLGFWLVVGEYAFGVLFSIALGIFVLLRSHSIWQVAMGLYLICLGINYLPMLGYALSIANKQNALAELGDEMIEERRAMSRYRRISLLLLVPMVLPVLTITRRVLGPRDPRGG